MADALWCLGAAAEIAIVVFAVIYAVSDRRRAEHKRNRARWTRW
jgi:hypothetical protein